ncbi:MAG TPA: cellulase family glycosylhydrolase, partial [Ramlibacter sp.]|nr:cellulase family glycosylhydrolase [Ramlibacter sp.]
MSGALKLMVAAVLLAAASHTVVDTQAASATLSHKWPAQACASVTPATCALAQALGRGINLGNMLDPPQEGDWGVKLEPAYIDKVAGAFTTVRVPVRWSNHAAPTADATLDPVFAARVDKAIDALLAKGVYVIVDVHHYSQLSGDRLHPNEFAVDPAVLETRLV